jgi:hypothetical protein
MSKGNQILKDAIAEAKVLRETALAQAKLVLEEAFTPQLQSILAAKLNELEEDKSEDEAYENIAEDSMEETLDLEALLAEADDEEKAGEEEETPAEKEAGEEKAGEEEEDKDITEMTPEEVEDYIRQIAAEEFEKLETEQGEELPGEEGEDLGVDIEDMPAGDEDINLDEMKDEDEDKKMEENIDAEITEDDINIDELLAEFGLSEEEEVEEGYSKEEDDSKSKMEEELAQALATIEELRSSLQESNLLNAKLLYMNKVFKGHNLTESQKIQVVKTFDKAESAKEAKLVFESLTSTLVKKEVEKSTIKESLGFASKASGIIAGSTTGNKVIDSDAQVDRWAKLAGLK